MPSIKEGVVLWPELSPHILRVVEPLDRIFVEYVGRPAVVTSGREGVHKVTSKHYSGEAIDLRSNDMDEATINRVLREIRTALGPDYDILYEGNHYHVEYDPK